MARCGHRVLHRISVVEEDSGAVRLGAAWGRLGRAAGASLRLAAVEVLTVDEWQACARAHADRVDAYLAPHLERRAAGDKHPVFDFMFTYYSFRPAQLRRWTPGFGRDPAVTAEHVVAQRTLLETLRRLLAATAGRAPYLGCFGLHEWAMVYRLGEDQTRHADWPLRLGPEGTDAVVESHRIACSHFDAYRFFTAPARPLNTLAPGRDDRPAFEQPGCFHAGMDLYKHAFRLWPMVSSDLVADCFELAWEIRVMDMRAAPYDLADLGFAPVRIETAEGKQEYVAAQKRFAEQAAPLRSRLLGECERLLAVQPW